MTTSLPLLTNLAGLRVVPLQPDARDDLEDGYLYVQTNLRERWSVGLISAASTRTEDLLMAQQAAAYGSDLLRLDPEDLELLRLPSRDAGCWEGLELTAASGNRYFVAVVPVDDDEDYDDED
jgi:hypothetical protein